MSDSRIRILIADDHEIARLGIKFYLMNENDFTVIGEASNGLEAYNKIVALRPDIAILDIFMPKLSGLEVCRKLQNTNSKPRIVLMTAIEEFADFWDVWESNAEAILLKDIRQKEFIHSLRKVFSGDRVFSSAIFQYMVSVKKTPNYDFVPNSNIYFNELQYKIIQHRMRGETFTEITRKLNCTYEDIAQAISSVLDTTEDNRFFTKLNVV
ncbi:MAG: response regulator [Candidatus Kapaibacteriales bacterium]